MGLLVLQVSVLVDTCLYNNMLTVSPLQFYAANVTKGYAAYFGVQSWHWNFSQVLYVLVGRNKAYMIFLFLWSVNRMRSRCFVLARSITSTVLYADPQLYHNDADLFLYTTRILPNSCTYQHRAYPWCWGRTLR